MPGMYAAKNVTIAPVLQVMHIAAVTEVHSRLLPAMETLHVRPCTKNTVLLWH